MSTYNKEYYLQNRDKIIANTKRWQQNNKERVRENGRQYREKLKDKMEMLEIELRAMKTTCEWFRKLANQWESKAVDLDIENKELRRQLALKNHVTKRKRLTLDDMICLILLAMIVAFIVFVLCISFKS